MLLFHLFCVLLALAVATVLHGAVLPAIGLAFTGSLVLTWIAGNASRGVALRKVIGVVGGRPIPDPPSGSRNADAWYVESVRPPEGLPHSCSFVEFDERGDYLDFHQHRHAYTKIKALAEEHEHLIIVIFVHGWRNNGHSQNVVSFNEFLDQLSAFSDGNGVSHRVHGVYISWRGACLKHALEQNQTFKDVTERYGGNPIVDVRQAARVPWLNELLETFSYFDRKSVPEHKFSGTSLSRTLVSCAHVAKRYRPPSRVFLIGHSFGGLMLERTFQNATIGELTKAWPWGDPELIKQASANPLPFDAVMLVNSAAPSIYAKQFQSYLAAHRQAMVRDKIVGSDSPIFFSLTSSGDWATGITHPFANSLCFLVPTLRRSYKGDDFILAEATGSSNVSIPQSYYYRHTPGHNPLLVNRFIEPVEASAADPQSEQRKHLHENLRPVGDIFQFTTSPRKAGSARAWKIRFPPETQIFREFSQYKAFCSKGYRPVAWQEDSRGNDPYKESAYWIVRCSKEIIADHNDIWSQQAMDTYAALYRIALTLRNQKPQ